MPADSTQKELNEIRSKKGKANPTQTIVTGTDSTQLTKPDTASFIKTPKDTTVKIVKHSPRKATLMSTLLPGLGQVYNHQWWKVPIIYGGFGGVVYGIAFNTKYFKDFRGAYKSRLEGNFTDPYVGKYTNANLEELQQFYRRNRDLCYVILAGVYVLNILDANVSAHLFDFDVSDDLSLRWQPSILTANSGQTVPALSLSLRFK